MQRAKLNFYKTHRADLLAAAAVVVLVMGCFAFPAAAQQAGQKTFSSAEEASNALFTAAQSNDEKAMLGILGARRESKSFRPETRPRTRRAGRISWRNMRKCIVW